MGCFIFGGGGKKADGDNLDFSQVTMEPQFGLAGKKFYNKNKELKTGTILNWDGTPLTLLDGETVPGADVVEPSLSRRYIPSGKYLGKPVELAPMAQGSVTGAQLDDQTFRITKSAGYIEGGTQDIAISGHMPSWRFINATANSISRFYVYTTTGFPEELSNMYAFNIIARDSVANGKIAAASFMVSEGVWYADTYVLGRGMISPSVTGPTVSPEGQWYLRFDISVKDDVGFDMTVVYHGMYWYWY